MIQTILLAVYLILEGINQLGYRFQSDNVVKGVLAIAAGILMLL
jgi:uncharacterized membrane protein HdeD (DUF308 family)